MLIFKYKRFHAWAKSERIPDNLIVKTIQEMNDGLYDVNLGGGLYKKRLPRPGQGKSGSYRTLIIFKKDEKAIFVCGFAKNEQENIGVAEKEVFKKLAHHYLHLTEEQLDILIEQGDLIEVKYHEKNE